MPRSSDAESTSPTAGGSRGRQPAAFEPGKVFGRYTIEAVLGEGSMGRVYRALDTRLGRKVALKVLLPGRDTDAEKRIARLEREGRAAAALDHPSAATVFDFGEIDGVPFISMELVAGRPLRRVMSIAEIGWQTRVRWLVDIASALAAAHRKGIIHRDIKPDNVMIRDDGRTKVLDFGIARRSTSAASRSHDENLPTLTMEGSIVGTPAYMSPEQIQAQPLDGRSDQFSWGVVAYELLARKPLWPNDAMIAVFQIVTAEAPSIRAARAEVPAEVEAIVARALAKDPRDRFASMDEIVAALEPFAASSAQPIGALLPAQPDEAPGSIDPGAPTFEVSTVTGQSATRELGDTQLGATRELGATQPGAMRDLGATQSGAMRELGDTQSGAMRDLGDTQSSSDDAMAVTVRAPEGSGSGLTPPVDLAMHAPEGPGADFATPADPAVHVPEGLGPSLTPPADPAMHAPEAPGPNLTPPADPAIAPLPAKASAGQARRPWRRFAIPALLIAVCILALAVYRHERAKPVKVTDLPSPPSSNEEAIALYRQGLAAHRRNEHARPLFERAVALDPGLAAAHVQLAMRAAGSAVDESARHHFNAARQYQAALSPRDQSILDAMEPLVRRQPSDWGEAARRISVTLSRFPHDAQLWYTEAHILSNTEGLAAGTQALDRALGEDPEYASALWLKGQNLSYLGRFTEAKAVFAECTRLSPTALDCALDSAAISQEEGACDVMESTARQVIAANNETPAYGYFALAESLASQRRPAETVREAIRQGVAAIRDADSRRAVESGENLRWALWTGDFDAAERGAREYLQLIEQRHERAPHARAALFLSQILEETGRVAEAGRAAMEFLNRYDAWEPDPRAEDYALADDPSPRLLAVAQRGGQLSREEVSGRRDRWVADWERRVGLTSREYIWLHGYAAVADNAADAQTALDALPRFGPIPPFRPRTLAWMGVGSAYLLTGRVDDAVVWLEAVTKSCHALGFPIEHTHAHAWLGRAREAKGDKAGACEAYRVVIQRWGRAKPRSVTSDRARERMAALGCGP